MELNMIHRVEDVIGYKFKDNDIVWEALQAAGSVVRQSGNRSFREGNKRLAIVGDAVLKLALVEDWYDGEEAREMANHILSTVASNANLNKVGRLHGLDELVNTNPSQRHSVSPVTMTATVEAVLGAIYLDGGLDAAKQVIQTLRLGPH